MMSPYAGPPMQNKQHSTCNMVFVKSSHSHMMFFFSFKGDSFFCFVECTWTFKKTIVGKKTCVVGKNCLQRPIQANLPCI